VNLNCTEAWLRNSFWRTSLRSAASVMGSDNPDETSASVDTTGRPENYRSCADAAETRSVRMKRWHYLVFLWAALSLSPRAASAEEGAGPDHPVGRAGSGFLACPRRPRLCAGKRQHPPQRLGRGTARSRHAARAAASIVSARQLRSLAGRRARSSNVPCRSALPNDTQDSSGNALPLNDAGTHRAIEPPSHRQIPPGGPIIPVNLPETTRPALLHPNRATQGAHNASSQLFARNS
jgi:hypothetical protein